MRCNDRHRAKMSLELKNFVEFRMFAYGRILGGKGSESLKHENRETAKWRIAKVIFICLPSTLDFGL
jgi:hypothetical protein